ncbi:MAG: carboxypeptidase-like regulatory domain-containing protein, partial [Muribaculaceae bacterium]|nr:carboxypeptidase-like regulatory domain-containing protein [Muribaculaceae bacterium]
MKIKKNFLRGTMLLASMLLCVASAFAQVTVTGQVLDETNQPVIGASVLVLDNNSGTATDLDGNFTVKAPSKSSKIRVTYMGYKTVEITAATAGTIVLEPTAANLDEVVV